MCEIKIKVNTQRIHTVKQIKSNNQGIGCENKMLGEIYLTRILRQWDELLFGIIGITHYAIKIVLDFIPDSCTYVTESFCTRVYSYLMTSSSVVKI